MSLKLNFIELLQLAMRLTKIARIRGKGDKIDEEGSAQEKAWNEELKCQIENTKYRKNDLNVQSEN